LGAYEVAAGFGILGRWALEWAGHGKAALLTYGAPHLVAELLTFAALLTSGMLLLADGPYTAVVVPVALGMLLYATFNELGREGKSSPRLEMAMVDKVLLTVAIILVLALGI
jgi:hypothetical protein